MEPTTVSVHGDRVVLSSGGGDGTAVIVPYAELERLKVRTLLGVSTLLLKTRGGRTVIADLLKPSDARAAADLIKQFLSDSDEPAAAVA